MRGFFCALLAGILWMESIGNFATAYSPSVNILYETEEDGQQEKLQLYAQAAVLLDADSGRVLYGKN